MNPHKLLQPSVSIDKNDWKAAEAEYSPNCGPSALAIMTGLPLMRVCPAIPNFKDRHYTNPSMMAAALRSLGVPFEERDDKDCDGHTLTKYGLCRIQWEGPWTAPGSNPRWAYRETHWIGAAEFNWPEPDKSLLFVFDVNCGWQTYMDWEHIHVPQIIKSVVSPRATGNWWATHRWELFV